MINIKKSILFVLLSGLLHFYFYTSQHIKKFDYELYDAFSNIFNKVQPQENASFSVIIDIDDKSIEKLGQWPWSRVINAQLINTIHQIKPVAIGVNILFPERDRVSPLAIQEFYKKFFKLNVNFIELPIPFRDNDNLLSQSLHNANATIATYFKNTPYQDPLCQKLSYKENQFSKIGADYFATSLTCNYKPIQNSVSNFGFINAWADSDGIFRRVPLFMNYNKKVFPSFALASILSFDKNIKLNHNQSTILLNFSQKKPKVISAVDVLNGNIEPLDIQGKIVILGSSIVGLDPKYITPNGKKISNNMIQAIVVENILTNKLLSQPKKYKKIHIFISFILSIIIMILFIKREYINIILFLFIVSIITLIWLIFSYINGIYISIGYLWIPSFYFFMLTLAYYLHIRNKEKQEEEKILIRQSKLASMGEMISLIAHQWRQPLSAINGIVLNIDIDHRKEILNSNKLDEHLNKIEETTAYLSKTINDFSDFFSKNKYKEYFYISDIIQQTKELLAISKDNNIKIIYKEKEETELLGYKSELIQSLLIILNNAIYACHKNNKNKEKGKIIIETKVLKKSIFISIEDNGGGIDSKTIQQIFNPYFTTKQKPHGTGLGLYILKLIIEESMSGKISITNGKEGAIFIIKIPINISI